MGLLVSAAHLFNVGSPVNLCCTGPITQSVAAAHLNRRRKLLKKKPEEEKKT
jgi:hypothetical protein